MRMYFERLAGTQRLSPLMLQPISYSYIIPVVSTMPGSYQLTFTGVDNNPYATSQCMS